MEKNKIDYKNIEDIDTIIKIDELLSIELDCLYKIKRDLFNIVNSQSIYSIDKIKTKFLKDNLLNLDEIYCLKGIHNQGLINEIVENYNKDNNSVTSHKLFVLEKWLIFDIENIIDSYFEKFEININGKSIIDKYFEILEYINNKEETYFKIRKSCAVNYKVLKLRDEKLKIKLGNLINVEDFKFICDEDFDEILFILKSNYNVKEIKEYKKTR